MSTRKRYFKHLTSGHLVQEELDLDSLVHFEPFRTEIDGIQIYDHEFDQSQYKEITKQKYEKERLKIMKSFNDWFNQNLKVSRYPVPKECKEMNFDYIINVSDEFIDSCMEMALKGGKRYFWFPLNECTSDIGINSIYGALQILYQAEKKNKKVYLHCHAGSNRSPTVAECYYKMRTGRYMGKKNARVLDNIESGHLPSIRKMNIFLKECSSSFKRDDSQRGGYLDSCKLKAKI